jgi:hypothetical protein
MWLSSTVLRAVRSCPSIPWLPLSRIDEDLADDTAGRMTPPSRSLEEGGLL